MLNVLLEEEIELTLSERIELEEENFRKENLDNLVNFLTKCEGQAITIENHGQRPFEELSWTFTRDRSQIIISDLSEMYGTQEIDIDNILSCGLQMFCMDEDVLEVELCNNDTLVISIV